MGGCSPPPGCVKARKASLHGPVLREAEEARLEALRSVFARQLGVGEEPEGEEGEPFILEEIEAEATVAAPRSPIDFDKLDRPDLLAVAALRGVELNDHLGAEKLRTTLRAGLVGGVTRGYTTRTDSPSPVPTDEQGGQEPRHFSLAKEVNEMRDTRPR